MRTSPVRYKKGEHRDLRPWHTDSVFKEKEERRGRRLQRTGSIISIIKGKGESAKVEVGETALWNYTAGTGKIGEIKKIDFLCPVLQVLFTTGKNTCCCSAKPRRPVGLRSIYFGHPKHNGALSFSKTLLTPLKMGLKLGKFPSGYTSRNVHSDTGVWSSG
jgi:hypothetical protein